jgi:hypothetical protein
MKNEFVKQHPHTLGLDYHTLIKYILGNKTNKYLPLIVKQIHNVSEDMMKRYNGEVNDEYVAYLKKYSIEDSVLGVLPDKHKLIVLWKLRNLGEFELDLKMLLEFDEMMENNLISETDISTYDSFTKIREQLNIAYTKKILKEERGLVDVVFENEEWLAIRPLTFEASKKYGAGTKWCTTSENNPHQFYRYSQSGVLIYLYNKLNNRKFGTHFNMEEEKLGTQVSIQIYNEVDDRIDSSDARIQFEVMDQLKKNIGLEPGQPSQTTATYIKNKYPDIWERYWVDYFDNTNAFSIQEESVVMGPEIEVEMVDNQLQLYGTYNDTVPTMTEGAEETQFLVKESDSESNELIDFVQQNIKPKNWFQNFISKVLSNRFEKLVMIGVPTRRFGLEAVDKTKRAIGETPGYKLFLYPIYDGNELVITKL